MRKLAGVLLALVTLAGCGAPSAGLGQSSASVSTPALRALKHSAHIADCPATHAPPAGGNGLPNVTLPCLGGGRSVDLARLRGPMVVNLWGQWCGPCRAELPLYARFAKQYAGKVQVVGIDWNDHIPRAALQLAKQSKVRYPLLADQQGQVHAVGSVLPQVLLVDRSGKVVFQRAMEINSLHQLKSMVASHLGVRG